MTIVRIPLHQRLLSRAVIDFETGCWNWTGYRMKNGYGLISEGGRYGRHLLTHRAAYELWNGPIPEGLQLDHLCRNRGCCNPAHMEAVTCRENLLRGNGWSGRKFRQTHCVNGHEFTPENTQLARDGRRRCCRACNRESTRRSYAKSRGTS